MLDFNLIAFFLIFPLLPHSNKVLTVLEQEEKIWQYLLTDNGICILRKESINDYLSE